MTITNARRLEIVSRKIDQLEKLYELASHKESSGPIDSTNDILILLRFTLSLERQIRQLQADFKSFVIDVINGKGGDKQ